MGAQLPVVEVAGVTKRNLPEQQEWVGTTYGFIDATIRAQVQGYLTRQNYKEGDFVRKGQTLFEIDSTSYEAALSQAEAELARMQAQGEGDDCERWWELAALTARVSTAYRRWNGSQKAFCLFGRNRLPYTIFPHGVALNLGADRSIDKAVGRAYPFLLFGKISLSSPPTSTTGSCAPMFGFALLHKEPSEIVKLINKNGITFPIFRSITEFFEIAPTSIFHHRFTTSVYETCNYHAMYSSGIHRLFFHLKDRP